MSQNPIEIGDIELIPEADRFIVSIWTQDVQAAWSVADARRAIEVLQAWVAGQESARGKPTKTYHVHAYDYHACCHYLQQRDGYDERDYAGRYTSHPTAPYQDFWHFVLDQAPEITNGSAFVMQESWGQDAEPWQQEILQKYLDTFGEEGDEGERVVDFYVGW